MINLNELIVFLKAAECANFSEAGRSLHLSQPAVSQTIDNLEKHFGTRLFLRKGRTVRLTEAGQVLKPMAVELLATARRLDETMTSIQGEVVGEMSVGCSTTSGKYLLPGLIAGFRQKYPLVRINVLISSRESVLNKLLAGEIPLGISSKLIEHHELEYQDFFEDDVILVAPRDHAWGRYRKVFPDDLLDEPIILREESAGTHEVLIEGLLAHDITVDMLPVSMVLGNAEAIEIAVEEGIGVAFISRRAAARGLEMGRIVEIKVEGMELKRKIYVVRNRKFPSTRAQTEFWNYVTSPEAEEKLKCKTPKSP